MKNLQEIYEGILDDNFANNDKFLIAQMFANENLQEYKYNITDDGAICFEPASQIILRDVELHEMIQLRGFGHLALYNCKINNLSSIVCNDGSGLRMQECEIIKYPKYPIGKQLYSLSLTKMKVEESKWIPNLMLFELSNLTFCDIDVRNKIIGTVNIWGADAKHPHKIKFGSVHRLSMTFLDLKDLFDRVTFQKVENLSVSSCACTSLKNMGEVLSQCDIGGCNNLESLEGLHKSENLSKLNIYKCDNLTSNEFIPYKNLTELCTDNMKFMCWTTDVIREKYPTVLKVRGTDPIKIDPSRGGEYKPGLYGVTKSSGKHSTFGSTRGTLMIDRIKKIGKASIEWDKTGRRSSMDSIVFKGDPNPRKNWDYKDANYSDITGVGIEIGDDVVVYLPSGAFGKNNGLAIDKVVGFTKTQVKLKSGINRYGADICILRSQKIAEKFFK